MTASGAGDDDFDFGLHADFYTFSPETLAQELPDFRIVREVGKGSMGVVYEAERVSDGTRVALKILPPSLTLTERALARFVREGRLMAQIEHPGLCRVLDLGHRGRLHWFAMEFVDGMTLEQRLASGPLPPRQAAQIAVQVARALQVAHDHGVVHRDVKPSNVMLLHGDQGIKITDFGLARETGTGSMTESGALVGTPMYMAPEQIRGERGTVDNRADVYGLGVTLYQLVCGVPPFAGPSTQVVLSRVLESDPPPPSRLRKDLPPALEAIVMKAIEKQPSDRYGSALEMAEDLERFERGEPVLARRRGPLSRALRVARRRPVVTAMLALITALALAFGLLWHNLREQQVETELAAAESCLARTFLQRDDQGRALGAEARAELLHRALAHAAAAIAHQPQHGRAWFVRAKVHHRLMHWDEALHDLDRAAELDGLSISLLHYRIDTLRQLRTRQAWSRLGEDLFELLEQDRSVHAWAMVVDHLLDLAQEASDADERQRTLALTERVLALAPAGDASPRVATARANLLELQGDRTGAVEAMRKAREAWPADPQVHVAAACFFARIGLRRESLAAAEVAQALDPAAMIGTDREVSGAGSDPAGARGFLDSLSRLIEQLEQPEHEGRERRRD